MTIVFNLYLAPGRHGFDGILDQVDQNLLERIGASFNLRGVVLCLRNDLQGFWDKLGIAEQANDVANDTVDFGAAFMNRRLQVGQALDDLADTVDLFIEDRHLANDRFLVFQLAIQNAEIVLDDREWVVDLVGYPARSFAVFFSDTGRLTGGVATVAQRCLKRRSRLFAKRFE